MTKLIKTLQLLLFIIFLCRIAFADAVLIDGSLIKGKLLKETDSTVVFETILGQQTVPKNKIDRIMVSNQYVTNNKDTVRHSATYTYMRDPHRQGLVFIPTAFMPQKNTCYFKDFELLFLTLGYTVTSSTALTVGALFPVFSGFQLFTFGFKQQLYVSSDQSRALAITGAITKPVGDFNEIGSYWVANMVGSFAYPTGAALHLSIGLKGISKREVTYDWNSTYYYQEHVRTVYLQRMAMGIGAETMLSRHSKFIAEIFNHGPFFDDNEEQYYFSLGLRFFGSNLSADIAGMRPLGSDASELFMWPFVNVGFKF